MQLKDKLDNDEELFTELVRSQTKYGDKLNEEQ